MTVYLVAQLTIHDRERYNRYVARFMPIIEKYGGRVLAADESPDVPEGEWGYRRLVLLEFPDKDTFWRWADSPEYREIAVDRIAAADGVMVLAEGIPAP
jgi:uncharacterized protein (DUF1330 family)